MKPIKQFVSTLWKIIRNSLNGPKNSPNLMVINTTRTATISAFHNLFFTPPLPLHPEEIDFYFDKINHKEIMSESGCKFTQKQQEYINTQPNIDSDIVNGFLAI